MANRPPPPESVSLENLVAEGVELYDHVLPPGRPIPIEVSPFPVDCNILGKEDISEAVMHLPLHRVGGPSIVRAKRLRMWLRATTREEDPEPGNWEKVFSIIQVAFRGVELT